MLLIFYWFLMITVFNTYFRTFWIFFGLCPIFCCTIFIIPTFTSSLIFRFKIHQLNFTRMVQLWKSVILALSLLLFIKTVSKSATSYTYKTCFRRTKCSKNANKNVFFIFIEFLYKLINEYVWSYTGKIIWNCIPYKWTKTAYFH